LEELVMRRLVLSLAAFFALTVSALAFAGFAPYNKTKFDTLVQSGVPVVAHVHATWCSTCRRQEVLLNELFKDPRFAKIQAVRVDYDKEAAFEKAHNVTSRATILVFKGGREVARVVFDTSRDKIRNALEAAL
jgi:thiol-disulfide isomerase/thioredoxin